MRRWQRSIATPDRRQDARLLSVLWRRIERVWGAAGSGEALLAGRQAKCRSEPYQCEHAEGDQREHMPAMIRVRCGRSLRVAPAASDEARTPSAEAVKMTPISIAERSLPSR
jgi:hypothetical protein